MVTALLQQITHTLAKLPTPPSSLALALSGGTDSLALAILLLKWRNNNSPSTLLYALTVDHQLRPESTKEALQVANMAKSLGFDHHEVLTCKWDNQSPMTLQTSFIQKEARRRRYDLMIESCLQYDVHHLLVGHHEKDQAETFLMRMFRGSGVDGLGCMDEFTRFHERRMNSDEVKRGHCGRGNDSNNKGVMLIRPLLTIKRAALEEMLSNDVSSPKPIHDPSNDDVRYDRVRARHALATIPQHGGGQHGGGNGEGSRAQEKLQEKLQERIAALSQDMRVASCLLRSQATQIFHATCSSLSSCGVVLIHDPKKIIMLRRELGCRVVQLCLQEVRCGGGGGSVGGSSGGSSGSSGMMELQSVPSLPRLSSAERMLDWMKGRMVVSGGRRRNSRGGGGEESEESEEREERSGLTVHGVQTTWIQEGGDVVVEECLNRMNFPVVVRNWREEEEEEEEEERKKNALAPMIMIMLTRQG